MKPNTQSSKNVVITGAASGLGKALAIKWATQQAHVCIVDINQQAGEQVCQQITALGGKAFFIHCDITNTASIQALIKQLTSYWQTIDILINNAGVASADKIEAEPLAQWRWVMEINLFGIVNMCQQFVPIFKQQGGGTILNVASQAGLTPIPFMSSYNASKAAVVSLSETLRLELADDNINVSVLCPGFFKTNLGSSLRTQLPTMEKLLGKLFDKSPINAEQVADIAYTGVSNNRFLLLTHSQGKRLYQLKRILPLNWYCKLVLRQTHRLRQMLKEEQR
ncbi:SDR family oxidoreductase [Shewanella inventionis]|uniref:Short chain dehydrogenase n=1 Tax=Shewanella inventionis TaxID=1738770 RepID=A0ABQ1IP83_9GAMM|nr:SDR family oxidoreductase [Shewanella inventionis]MCL1157199.1 SDR family oxidoreductase [Shewanella inventionis]UAL41943.1 SDR family oxidoreductase [Shewanella inventionis]GGB49081.1 short chain dehydrogenase [Shewanella inventionis]